MLKWLYLLAPLPMVLWNSCDMRGPKGPKRCGGRPLASSRATEIKITNVLSTTSLVHAKVRCAFVKDSRDDYKNHVLNKGPCHKIPWSLPISESSDSLSPDVVMPTAPVTELEAGYTNSYISWEYWICSFFYFTHHGIAFNASITISM